mmetsp:Transcript_40130/g.105823  ORF Transcript_40130/g.105823 Transcript_40130/m.105823 type:complete len:201 (-) Transcript_40130:2-604(-)
MVCPPAPGERVARAQLVALPLLAADELDSTSGVRALRAQHHRDRHDRASVAVQADVRRFLAAPVADELNAAGGQQAGLSGGPASLLHRLRRYVQHLLAQFRRDLVQVLVQEERLMALPSHTEDAVLREFARFWAPLHLQNYLPGPVNVVRTHRSRQLHRQRLRRCSPGTHQSGGQAEQQASRNCHRKRHETLEGIRPSAT